MQARVYNREQARKSIHKINLIRVYYRKYKAGRMQKENTKGSIQLKNIQH